MKVFRILTSVGALVLVMTLSVWSLGAAAQAPAPQAAPAAQQQSPAADRTFDGELSKVDTTAKLITATGTGNKQMTFTYTDATQIVGVENNVQGLTGKTGSALKITYREEGGNNRATKIEVLEKQPAPKQ